LVGSRFSLGKDAQEALYGSTPFAEVSNLRAPENRAERHFGKLLEVYLGVRTDSGRPLLFETYQRYDAITRSSRRIMQGALPALLVGLTLLYTVQAPLAYGLASRLRRAQREREQALLDTLAVSDRERRRIAADLHDGVVQGLAGVSYTLSAAGDRAEAAGDAADASLLRGAAQDLRSWVRELRTLVVTIAPPTLHRAGLSAALEDLRGTLSSRGVEVSTAIDTLPPLPPQVETLAFRVAQEAVRNIIKHARATSVTLSAGLTDGVLSVEIADDGCGLSAAGGATHDGGHGLALLTDLTRSQGGDLTVSAGADGTGTTVLLLVPTDEGSPPAQRVPSARRPVAAP
jgi:signal transduction histidine kinase